MSTLALPAKKDEWEFTETALVTNGRPSLESFSQIGRIIGRAHRASAWWIADWYNAGEDLHGEQFSQVLDTLGIEPETVIKYAWVGRNISVARRRASLSFSHHREVADLPPAEQNVWLARADAETISSHRLRRELAKAIRHESRLWVLAEAKSPADADALLERMTGEGRAAKIIER